MVIYPALIALDLRRRRAGRRDLGCCCMGSPAEAKKVFHFFIVPFLKRDFTFDIVVVRSVRPVVVAQ